MKKNLVSALELLALFIGFPIFSWASNEVFGQTQPYGFQVDFPQLSFSQPVGIFNAGDNSDRLFVIEQSGIIRVFHLQTPNDALVFLDIQDRVLSGGEQGLLGLEFHPNYINNGYFYVNYIMPNPTRTIISRFTISNENPNQANKNSEHIILEITQPFSNHNGGQLAFGPDGYLYIGLGDGGGGGDPFGNAQNKSTLLGKILRIDVNPIFPEGNYTIPNENPFARNSLGYREEIYAYGFRNPWRFSFDFLTGKLWVGDVGQSRIEEVDIVENGKNYGWNIMEGNECYNVAFGCNETGLEFPIFDYDHTLGNAIIGGYVYRGSALPELKGSYIYGDYGSGKIWALFPDGTNLLLGESNLNISSF